MGKRKLLTYVSFTLLLVASAAAATESRPSGLYVWQGFDYAWLRTLAGFSTPHRLGPFEARVEAGDFTNPTDATTTAHMQFDVGVDGDFSRPRIFSTAIAGEKLWVSETAVDRKSVTDSASKGKAPTAETKYTSTVTVPVSDGSGRDSYVALLQGVSVGMHCDPTKQDKGDVCNSNGMWPEKFSFRLSDCTVDSKEMKCQLDVNIVRAWTPMKGGGKPFNYKMDLDIKTYVSVIGGYKDDLNVIVPPSLKMAGSNRDKDLMHKVHSVQTSVGGYSKAVVGLQGFEVTLTGSNQRKGRYLERIAFRVGTDSSVSDKISAFAMAGYLSSKTVYQTDVAASVQMAVLQLGPNVRVSSPMESRGQICRSGLGFSCKMKGLEETTTSSVATHSTPTSRKEVV